MRPFVACFIWVLWWFGCVWIAAWASEGQQGYLLEKQFVLNSFCDKCRMTAPKQYIIYQICKCLNEMQYLCSYLRDPQHRTRWAIDLGYLMDINQSPWFRPHKRYLTSAGLHF